MPGASAPTRPPSPRIRCDGLEDVALRSRFGFRLTSALGAALIALPFLAASRLALWRRQAHRAASPQGGARSWISSFNREQLACSVGVQALFATFAASISFATNGASSSPGGALTRQALDGVKPLDSVVMGIDYQDANYDANHPTKSWTAAWAARLPLAGRSTTSATRGTIDYPRLRIRRMQPL